MPQLPQGELAAFRAVAHGWRECWSDSRLGGAPVWLVEVAGINRSEAEATLPPYHPSTTRGVVKCCSRSRVLVTVLRSHAMDVAVDVTSQC